MVKGRRCEHNLFFTVRAMKILHSIRKFIRERHPDKQWRKLSPYKLFESPTLSQTIKKKYVPTWFRHFYDHELGGFHERLDDRLNPLPVGYKRLLSQCRQIYLYTESDSQPRTLLPQLKPAYDFLITHYYQGDGRWIFSCTPEGAPYDQKLDFYGHAFTILCLSCYGRAAEDQNAQDMALSTLHFIRNMMRHSSGRGYVEALDPNLNPIPMPRRQDPHMHLFEACLFAFEATRNDDYLKECHSLFDLFETYFFDPSTGTLHEFFNDDLSRLSFDKQMTEAGHHFEWVWLLDFYMKLCPDISERVKPYIKTLYDWACRHGYDDVYGGLYDEQRPNGDVITDTKRIWPLCEAIRAHRVMRDHDGRAVDLLETTKRLLNTRYLRSNGAWVESWSRDFKTITTDYLPATSVYHL